VKKPLGLGKTSNEIASSISVAANFFLLVFMMFFLLRNWVDAGLPTQSSLRSYIEVAQKK
jgi:predicted PurR-regulated permease PerM